MLFLAFKIYGRENLDFRRHEDTDTFFLSAGISACRHDCKKWEGIKSIFVHQFYFEAWNELLKVWGIYERQWGKEESGILQQVHVWQVSQQWIHSNNIPGAWELAKPKNWNYVSASVEWKVRRKLLSFFTKLYCRLDLRGQWPYCFVL